MQSIDTDPVYITDYNVSTSPHPLAGKAEGEKVCRTYTKNKYKK